MTWEKAQTYCRKHHYDLATVQSNENWTRLQEAADENLFTGFAWIGLYNDVNSWRWSYDEESLLFQSWAWREPNNYGYGEECAGMFSNGAWFDLYCHNSFYFVCYNESSNATQKMVLINTRKTWHDAQTFCRDHHTDLATIRSQDDNDQIISLIYDLVLPVWIGLYRETWKWSNRASVTNSTQLAIQTFTRWQADCVGADIYHQTIGDRFCTKDYYFYCNTVKRKRQVIRVQVKSGPNGNEAKLKALVLNELKQTLNNQDVTLTWRTQPNGKVFLKDSAVRKRSETNTNDVCSLK
ncbi:Mannose-binding protein A [Labeo rohita]|uniref:Mannose-binding protein A n=1 Tax=Labeo rohita TaxID=84645 RepID=A0ABQ8MK12_LABRO|nr:Mannose-binding protein A [Labeo rohita]